MKKIKKRWPFSLPVVSSCFLLTAYRSHELVDNMEMEEGDLEFLGNPVAQFRIESHFDVMRGYNPNTGDQSNKIVEDTRTRPWYERDYMRVDWSVNLLRDPSSIEGFITYWAQAAYYCVAVNNE